MTGTAKTSSNLTGQDLVYGYLTEYLDGELPTSLAARFDSELKSHGGADLPARFQAVHGRLQLAFQTLFLRESELQELRAFAQDPSVAATMENVQIEQIGRGDLVHTLLRRLTLVAIAALIVAGLVWRFGRTNEPTFKSLEYLGYEALAMEEDPTGRINLPTQDLQEIRQFFASYPGLEFKPRVLNSISEWQPDGASVIDYEIAKVAVVQYSNVASKEKLFHFSYAGELADLPKSQTENIQGFVFQTYASDQLNLIAWQSAPAMVSLLVGRRAALVLAGMASAGSATN